MPKLSGITDILRRTNPRRSNEYKMDASRIKVLGDGSPVVIIIDVKKKNLSEESGIELKV